MIFGHFGHHVGFLLNLHTNGLGPLVEVYDFDPIHRNNVIKVWHYFCLGRRRTFINTKDVKGKLCLLAASFGLLCTHWRRLVCLQLLPCHRLEQRDFQVMASMVGALFLNESGTNLQVLRSSFSSKRVC